MKVAFRGSPWFSLALVALATLGAFWTRGLLKDGVREGAWLAAATFGCDILTAATMRHLGVGVVLSAVGFLMAANIYRQLR